MRHWLRRSVCKSPRTRHSTAARGGHCGNRRRAGSRMSRAQSPLHHLQHRASPLPHFEMGANAKWLHRRHFRAAFTALHARNAAFGASTARRMRCHSRGAHHLFNRPSATQHALLERRFAPTHRAVAHISGAKRDAPGMACGRQHRRVADPTPCRALPIAAR